MQMQTTVKELRAKLVGGTAKVMKHETTLKHGFLSMKKREMTILLVGETGVGKTALVNLLGNVLHGHSPQTYRDMHDASKEANGADVGSKTPEALIYRFTSQDGIKICLIDTPGLADSRGIEHDEHHKASIVRVIRDAIPMIDGVLIVANGATERLDVVTDYAITTMASFLPCTMADNIAIVFTTVVDPKRFDFKLESLPGFLRQSKVYFLDNPIALMKRHQESKRKLLVPTGQLSKVLRLVTIGEAHDNAIGILAELFDWLDQCTVQPTSSIVTLYESLCIIDSHIRNALISTDVLSKKKRDVAQINADISNMKQVDPLNIYSELINIYFLAVDGGKRKLRDHIYQINESGKRFPPPQHSLFTAILLLQLSY
jgi:GTPase SAR1 family protein